MTANELRRRFPNAPESFIRDNADRVCPVDAKRVEGQPLGGAVSRKEKSGSGTDDGVRRRIVFRVFAMRPADYDGYHIKELQDLLCHAGVLAGDAWDQLEGGVVSEKVHTPKEERTEILIY